MKLCPTCESRVADDATVCPNCGMDLSAVFDSSLVEVPLPEAQEAATAPVLSSSSATLTLQRGGVMAESFTINGEAVIGRFDAASGPVDVDLSGLPEAGWVSRRHARLRCDETGQWWIQDLESSNGTFVRSNGRGPFRRLTSSGENFLQNGDEIALGNARFAFRVQE